MSVANLLRELASAVKRPEVAEILAKGKAAPEALPWRTHVQVQRFAERQRALATADLANPAYHGVPQVTPREAFAAPMGTMEGLIQATVDPLMEPSVRAAFRGFAPAQQDEVVAVVKQGNLPPGQVIREFDYNNRATALANSIARDPEDAVAQYAQFLADREKGALNLERLMTVHNKLATMTGLGTKRGKFVMPLDTLTDHANTWLTSYLARNTKPDPAIRAAWEEARTELELLQDKANKYYRTMPTERIATARLEEGTLRNFLREDEGFTREMIEQAKGEDLRALWWRARERDDVFYKTVEEALGPEGDLRAFLDKTYGRIGATPEDFGEAVKKRMRGGVEEEEEIFTAAEKAKIKATKPVVAPKTPEEALIAAAKKVEEKTKFPDIRIAELAKEAKVPLEEAKEVLKQMARDGKAFFSMGDWSLANEATRKGVVTLTDDVDKFGEPRRYLMARILHDEVKKAAEPAWKKDFFPRMNAKGEITGFKSKATMSDVPAANYTDEMRAAVKVTPEEAAKEEAKNAALRAMRSRLTRGMAAFVGGLGLMHFLTEGDGEAYAATLPVGRVLKEVPQLMNEMVAARRVAKMVEPGQEMLRPDQMLSYAPILPAHADTETMAKALEATGKQARQLKAEAYERGYAQGVKAPNWYTGTLSKWMSPYGAGELLHNADVNVTTNLANAQVASEFNSKQVLTALDNIFKKAGIQTDVGMVAEAYRPLAGDYVPKFLGYFSAKATLERLNGRQAAVAEQLLSAKGRGAKRLNAEMLHLSDDILEAQKRHDELLPEMQLFQKKWDETTRGVAEKSASARVFLSLDGKTLWVEDMLQPNEKLARDKLRIWLTQYKGRMKEAGHSVLDEAYAPHVFHPDWNEANVMAALENIGRSTGSRSLSPSMTHFFQRSLHSLPMVPDIVYAMQRYVPDAERRLAFDGFWGKKSDPGSWYSISKSAFVQQNPLLKDFWERITNATKPNMPTPLDRWADRYTALESLRLLSFVPSTGFKHYFKLVGTAASLGFAATLKRFPEAVVRTVKSNLASEGLVADAFRRMGITQKIPRDAVDDMISAYGKQHGLTKALVDIQTLHDIRPSTGMAGKFWNRFDAALLEANKRGGIFINLVESQDRADAVLAGIQMAARQGMTADQAMHAVLSTILKNSFLGGVMNPTWLKSPVFRSIMLFQNTAYKILERRIVTSIKAGKILSDLYHAYPIAQALRRGELKKAGLDLQRLYSDIVDVRRHVRTGEALFKQNAVLDALKQESDVFGNSALKQFFREAIYTGAVLGVGGATATELWGHLFHMPFMQPDSDEFTLAVNPALNALTRSLRHSESYDDEDDSFYVQRFFQNWLGQTGYMPNILNKMLRISQEDIPEKYQDSWLRYLFVLPPHEE